MKSYYEYAKEAYAANGVDCEKAIETLESLTISVHCWQGDDVGGFDTKDALSGGIQATGNYPGKARTPDELMADFDKVLALTGGKKKLNLHASYAIFEKGEDADRDALEPKHFAKWVEFAKARGLGLDFNPTYFSHPKAAGLTLSSPNEEIRQFWVRHTIACLRIAEYFADETGTPCVMNIWIPDGYKDIPADRTSPRARFAKSLDEALACGYDKSKVFVTLESKVFGIGLESYTVGSAEFCQNYAATRHIMPLMDNGHYHPTEMVSDKISSLLLFHPKLALHITRPVRWDSDHVVRFDDETREIAKEIVASGRLDDIVIALDYFDASINRVAAWVMGIRSTQKALLEALLTPHAELSALQQEEDYTRLFMRQEALKMLPLGAVWEEFCRRAGLPAGEGWYDEVMAYEAEVLKERS
ncbi:MAG: L-rhamnose isomerase [Clostridia bacterium]|nr:L-rhamnose isomerase [Clostridia bacterium]